MSQPVLTRGCRTAAPVAEQTRCWCVIGDTSFVNLNVSINIKALNPSGKRDLLLVLQAAVTCDLPGARSWVNAEKLKERERLPNYSLLIFF